MNARKPPPPRQTSQRCRSAESPHTHNLRNAIVLKVFQHLVSGVAVWLTRAAPQLFDRQRRPRLTVQRSVDRRAERSQHASPRIDQLNRLIALVKPARQLGVYDHLCHFSDLPHRFYHSHTVRRHPNFRDSPAPDADRRRVNRYARRSRNACSMSCAASLSRRDWRWRRLRPASRRRSSAAAVV